MECGTECAFVVYVGMMLIVKVSDLIKLKGLLMAQLFITTATSESRGFIHNLDDPAMLIMNSHLLTVNIPPTLRAAFGHYTKQKPLKHWVKSIRILDVIIMVCQIASIA